MTRTTELLEELKENIGKEQYYFNSNNPKIKEKYYRKVLQSKSELRGRLDALKEEEKFILRLIEIENKHDTDIHLPHLVDLELASIQEEIKLIEAGI